MPVRTYRKTAKITALQWTGFNERDVIEFCPSVRFPEPDNPVIEIPTLEGLHRGLPGCWVAKGVKGEFWPIDEGVFAQSYVEDGPEREPEFGLCTLGRLHLYKRAALVEVTIEQKPGAFDSIFACPEHIAKARLGQAEA